jgi:hypothetical protein
MAKDKPSFGFTTSAKQIEDAFTKAQKELEKTRTDWNALRKHFIPLYKLDHDLIMKAAESRKITDIELVSLSHLFSTLLLTKLGVELAEVHTRLVKVEKRVEEIKLIKK